MPYITAREDAGLSPSPAAADADSYVAAGSRIAVAWVRSAPMEGLAIARLAGRYTCPGGTAPLQDGEQRYLNPDRFIIPEEAWIREPGAGSGAGPLPPEVAQLNHHYEGCRLQAYPDPRSGGKPITIGWGSTFYQDGSPIRLGDVITQEQADALYEHNCQEKFWKVLEATIPFWAEMNDRQRAALCSFAYNNGAHFHGDGHHDTLDRHLLERRWEAVPGALMMYRNPGERVEVGLGRRRRAEGLVWTGMEPAAACTQAEREISTPADCETWEQRLKQEAAAAPTRASRAIQAPPPAPAGEGPLVVPGMVGPSKTPRDFGFRGSDSHVVVNDASETAKAYDTEGRLLWEVPALARGQGRENQWQETSTDTPPGIYRIAKKVYRDYEQDPSPTYSPDRCSYGWYSFDLEDLEMQERRFGRAGIMVHGGGSACGWPGAWAPHQPLHSTLGCVRLYNQDLRDKLLPLVEKGTVYVSVYQEA